LSSNFTQTDISTDYFSTSYTGTRSYSLEIHADILASTYFGRS